MVEQHSQDYILINDNRMYVDSKDERVRALRQRGGVMHPPAIRMWKTLTNSHPWDWIADVGANYGEMLLESNHPPATRLLAIEPNPRVIPYLRKTLEESLPQAQLLQVAVGARAGTSTFFQDVSWSGNSTLCEEWLSDRDHEWAPIQVQMATLSEILDQSGVRTSDSALIKLDIEGAEPLVLRECLPRLMEFQHCAVFVEVVRFSSTDLLWLLEKCQVFCFHGPTSSLIPYNQLHPNLHDALQCKGIHRRDVLAVPISRSTVEDRGAP